MLPPALLYIVEWKHVFAVGIQVHSSDENLWRRVFHNIYINNNNNNNNSTASTTVGGAAAAAAVEAERGE